MKISLKAALLAAIAALALTGVTFSLRESAPLAPTPLPTVPELDLQRYSGTWYEIVRMPMRQEHDCTHVTATYTPAGEYVEVVNKCMRDGALTEARGKAYPDPAVSGRLEVYFSRLQPRGGDYNVIALDADYQWSVVGTNSRKYAWILSRTPQIAPELLESLKQVLVVQGFDVSKLIYTEQK